MQRCLKVVLNVSGLRRAVNCQRYVMRFGNGSKTKKKEQATSTALSRTVVALSMIAAQALRLRWSHI